MFNQNDYQQKFESFLTQTLFNQMTGDSQDFVREISLRHHLSFQEVRQISEISVDFTLWGSPSIESIWPDESAIKAQGKDLKKRLLNHVTQHWQTLKQSPNQYSQNKPLQQGIKVEPVSVYKGKLGLGHCPVASPKTLCCNLMTLDAVDNCGYGCSYCSIQSFFDGKQISFDRDFAQKLSRLELDPEQNYHIGTGQSSDSLMWGNSHGVLDSLLKFADENPNVILEFKTKSANISHLLKQNLPRNILYTWSLNTPDIILNEERGTVTLEKRIDAARKMANHGAVVGFHFHPMVHYDRWREDYAAVFQLLMDNFDPAEVAMVSLGTLTFIKPVMREIRKRGIQTQILKMPLIEADGKLSYPDEIKQEMFRHAYQSFNQEWQQQVFFYLCMENQRHWEPVFGYQYPSNDEFEQAMKKSYMDKILAI